MPKDSTGPQKTASSSSSGDPRTERSKEEIAASQAAIVPNPTLWENLHTVEYIERFLVEADPQQHLQRRAQLEALSAEELQTIKRLLIKAHTLQRR